MGDGGHLEHETLENETRNIMLVEDILKSTRASSAASTAPGCSRDERRDGNVGRSEQ